MAPRPAAAAARRRPKRGQGSTWAGYRAAKSTESGVPTAYKVRKATWTGACSRVPARPHAVQDPRHARTLQAREPGDLFATRGHGATGRRGKAMRRTPLTDGGEKSDGAVVPTNPSNKAGRPAAER